MYRKYFKRYFDLLISIFILTLTSPLILLVSILIYIFNGRPIFFIQERPGYKTKVFKIFKFRTMNLKIKNTTTNEIDNVTKLGKFLRYSSIDELPGLINVIKGDMSIVGPRPLLTEYLPKYDREQIKRHDCMPGITGLAQVNGRNKLDWDERLALDLIYSRKISFFFRFEDHNKIYSNSFNSKRH